jgi:hypothetical protein
MRPWFNDDEDGEDGGLVDRESKPTSSGAVLSSNTSVFSQICNQLLICQKGPPNTCFLLSLNKHVETRHISKIIIEREYMTLRLLY